MVVNNETFTNDTNLYTRFKRRSPKNGGSVTEVKVKNTYIKFEINNKWIIPYSLSLSRLFQKHAAFNILLLNTASQSSPSNTSAYIYIYKGNGQAVFLFSKTELLPARLKD